MIIRDKVIKYGNDVNTDVIIPARYLNTTNEEELASHCFEDLDENFKQKALTRKIIVAGDNFGCGSSREHAPLAIKASGIKLVIARTFARIFFRNAVNTALPVLLSKEASENVNDGDELEVDLEMGLINDLTTGKTYKINQIPAFIQEIISSGGYINYTKKKLGSL
ncbi:MAG: 3-isopropylmalate dehydratase small subunit [Actinobacteria bacterium]|nr:3-isopropylmalate dehydratase small subunit [Actinomycetota bacterium]